MAHATDLKVGGGGKAKKSRGPRLLTPFTAALKLVGLQKMGSMATPDLFGFQLKLEENIGTLSLSADYWVFRS